MSKKLGVLALTVLFSAINTHADGRIFVRMPKRGAPADCGSFVSPRSRIGYSTTVTPMGFGVFDPEDLRETWKQSDRIVRAIAAKMRALGMVATFDFKESLNPFDKLKNRWNDEQNGIVIRFVNGFPHEILTRFGSLPITGGFVSSVGIQSVDLAAWIYQTFAPSRGVPGIIKSLQEGYRADSWKVGIYSWSDGPNDTTDLQLEVGVSGAALPKLKPRWVNTLPQRESANLMPGLDDPSEYYTWMMDLWARLRPEGRRRE